MCLQITWNLVNMQAGFWSNSSGGAVTLCTSNKLPGKAIPLGRGSSREHPGADCYGNTVASKTTTFFLLHQRSVNSLEKQHTQPKGWFMLETSQPCESSPLCSSFGKWFVTRSLLDFLWWKSSFPGFLSSCFGLYHVRLGYRKPREPSCNHKVTRMTVKGHHTKETVKKKKKGKSWGVSKLWSTGQMKITICL